MSTSTNIPKLNAVREVAVIREQLAFLRARLAMPLPQGIAHQFEEAMHSLRVLENLVCQYYEWRASE